jgi:predicted transcriptional regulator
MLADYTEIIPCSPPAMVETAAPSSQVPVDGRIMQVLVEADRPMELREITRLVDDTTHHVHARVQELVRKGLVVWNRHPERRRGPGASTYWRAEVS